MGILKHFFFLVFIFLNFIGSAQFTEINVDGRLFGDGNRIKEGKVEIFKDGDLYHSIDMGRSSRFTFELPFGADYYLVFSRKGFYPKKIGVHAKDATLENVDPFFRFDVWEVNLIREVPGLEDLSFIDEPMGEVYFHPRSGNFKWDAEYAKLIEAKLAKFEKQIESAEVEEKIEKSKDSSLEPQLNDVKIVDEVTTNEEPQARAFSILEEKTLKKSPERNLSSIEIQQLDVLLEGPMRNMPIAKDVQIEEHPRYIVEIIITSYQFKNDITYRAVRHDWGGAFFYKNGVVIGRNQFEFETLTQAEFIEREKARETEYR